MDDDVCRISLQIKSKLDLKEVLTTSDTSASETVASQVLCEHHREKNCHIHEEKNGGITYLLSMIYVL